MEKPKNKTPKWFDRFNKFQQKNVFLRLPIAIFKKYSDDDGGHLAAVMTYYGFLALFPILIIATALAQIISRNNAELETQIVTAVTSYFPAIAETLTTSLQTPAKTGLALAVGLAIIALGARGLVEATQYALHVVWSVPRQKRGTAAVRMGRGAITAVLAGLGLLLAAVFVGYATNAKGPYLLMIASGTVGFVLLFSVFWGIFTFGSSARKRRIANIPGAIIAAVGLLLLQSLSGYFITQQLYRYTGLYAQFGVVLVLLLWIYLQALVFLLALEYNTVKAHGLYPRSLDDNKPIEADKRAHELYAARDSYKTDVTEPKTSARRRRRTTLA